MTRNLRTAFFSALLVLAVAVPVFLVGLLLYVPIALGVAFFRATYIDFWGVVICVVAMSISSMFYIIGGQFLIGKLWHLVPISGYSGGPDALRFLFLPILVSVVGGLGGSVRLYRTFFLEEINRDYVRTARAKGLSEVAVLFRHVLKNAMIPILTGVVVAIPLLFIGGLYAAHLAKLADVAVLDTHQAHIDAIRKHGLELSGRTESVTRLSAFEIA